MVLVRIEPDRACQLRVPRVLATLDGIARRHDVQPATIALASLVKRLAATAPIVSASHVDQVDSF